MSKASQYTEEPTAEDLELLESLGFQNALRRAKGFETIDDQELSEDYGTPSQRGMSAVVSEYQRMGISFED